MVKVIIENKEKEVPFLFHDLYVGEWFLWDETDESPNIKLEDRKFGYYDGEALRTDSVAFPEKEEVLPLDVVITVKAK